MLHASTTRSTRCCRLDVNAKIHEGEAGVGCGLSALSWVLSRARLFLRAVSCSPFIPPVVDGKLSQVIRHLCSQRPPFFQFLSRGEVARL
ncbi:hypothetical protein ACLK1T_17825 [Escherichia coli]